MCVLYMKKLTGLAKKLGTFAITTAIGLGVGGCGTSAEFSGLKNRDETTPYIDNCIKIAKQESEYGEPLELISSSKNHAHLRRSNVSGEWTLLTSKDSTDINIYLKDGRDVYNIDMYSSLSGFINSPWATGLINFQNQMEKEEGQFLKRVGKHYETRHVKK